MQIIYEKTEKSRYTVVVEQHADGPRFVLAEIAQTEVDTELGPVKAWQGTYTAEAISRDAAGADSMPVKRKTLGEVRGVIEERAFARLHGEITRPASHSQESTEASG